VELLLTTTFIPTIVSVDGTANPKLSRSKVEVGVSEVMGLEIVPATAFVSSDAPVALDGDAHSLKEPPPRSVAVPALLEYSGMICFAHH
jgi:hypothetical protein